MTPEQFVQQSLRRHGAALVEVARRMDAAMRSFAAACHKFVGVGLGRPTRKPPSRAHQIPVPQRVLVAPRVTPRPPVPQRPSHRRDYGRYQAQRARRSRHERTP